MFSKLYMLYAKRNSNRTPLEDFNTECFAGVLNMSPGILDSFIDFLELSRGEYKVTTQAHYSLAETSNCIIDMVLESESTVCFIENKVNSKEGWEQLDRYTQVLNKYYANAELKNKKNIHLKYCTKNVDIKQRAEFEFSQFRWFQIGKLLAENHNDDALASNYLNFLQQNGMAIDPSISTDTVVTLKNFRNTYDTMEYHIEESAKNFKNAFPKAKLAKRHKTDRRNDLEAKNRISNSIPYPLKDTSVNSEILYSIDFDEVQLQSQIWLSKDHPQIVKVLELAEKSKLFEFIQNYDIGLGLRNRQPLYTFIENENSDKEIKQWFKESFEKIRKFIEMTPELGWSDNVIIRK
ncbi:PD-(D/E)XK nuclease family protein [Cryomorphaceae bacterium 1068]|nr:PD-(D/E)XK nuclease family protein [Cryomorphaceae bacterium 1068]